MKVEQAERTGQQEEDQMNDWQNLDFDQEQEDGAATSGQDRKETEPHPQNPAANVVTGSGQEPDQTQ